MRATFQNHSVIMIPIVFLRITLDFYACTVLAPVYRGALAYSSNYMPGHQYFFSPSAKTNYMLSQLYARPENIFFAFGENKLYAQP